MNMDWKKAYQRAADIYHVNAEKCVLNESPAEHWIEGTEDFWYIKDIENPEKKIGARYMRYSFAENKERDLFCHEKLAELIAPYCKEEPDAFQLPIEIHEVSEAEIYFSIPRAKAKMVGEFVYRWKEEKVECSRFALHAQQEVLSPDKKYSIFVREHNLFCRDNDSGEEEQMTFDGTENLDYGLRFQPTSDKYLSDTPMQVKPGIVWAPDSRHFMTYRTDRRLLGNLYLVQSVPKNGSARPNGLSYRYALPGDEHILEGQVYLGSVGEEKKTVQKVLFHGEPVVLYLLALFGADGKQLKWTEDGKAAYLIRYDRFFKTIQCILIDTDPDSDGYGSARVLFQETYKTFGFVEYYGSASQEIFSEPSVCYLPQTKELLWHSEIEGWSALYLYDGETGALKRKLTCGEWTFRRLKYVDEKNRTVYFTAGGKEEGLDPYYQMLYRVGMDRGEPELLTKEAAEHFIRFSPNGSYCLDTYSTIQTVPKMVVRRPDGSCLTQLTEADISRIVEKGYQVPEPFTAIGRDGKTVIYGILIKPADFDPHKKYPVVDYIYGGSQRINTPKAFEFNRMPGYFSQGGLQSLAQLGFVGIIVDGFATPLRSKEIHDYGYGKAEECCGLQEHVLAVKQLAERYSWIDSSKVGIWGASGGGYATARALLEFPDFYTAGVSCCGNHDQARYHAHWGERWIGEYSPEAYQNQANASLADRLEGHLLLIHGDMDDNVHPGATIALINALIEANKDFDCLIYPNSAHAVARFPYVIRKKWDYFVRHLYGAEPPKNFDIRPPKEDKESGEAEKKED